MDNTALYKRLHIEERHEISKNNLYNNTICNGTVGKLEGIEYKVPVGLALCETWATCPAVGLEFSCVKEYI